MNAFKKDLKDMTFAEFLEEAKKQGIDPVALEGLRNNLLSYLQEDGFSEQQINEMKMEKIFDAFLMVAGQDFERFFDLFGKKLRERSSQGNENDNYF